MELTSVNQISYNDSELYQCHFDCPVFDNICIFRRTTPASSNPHNTNPRTTCSHPNFVLWIPLTDGGTLRVSDCNWILKRGETFIVLPWQSHYRIARPDMTAEWIVIRFSGTNQNALQLFRNNRMTLSEEAQEDIQKLLDIWLSEDSDCRKLLLNAQLSLLIAHLRTCIANPDLSNTETNALEDKYVKDIMQELMVRYLDKKVFEEIATKWSITPEYLKRIFKKKIGCSYQSFFNGRRLQIARHLLGHSKLSIGDIASQVGFQSIYAFSRFFRLHTKESPNSYRNNIKK